jgi:uncharacterized protein
MRTTVYKSDYIIPIEIKDKGTRKMLLIHGYTGAIDVVSVSVWENIHNGDYDKLSEDTFNTLLQRGYLTQKTKEQEAHFVCSIHDALHLDDMLTESDITWVVTYNCNFRCPYCFEDREMKNGTQSITFTKEEVDNAFRLISSIQKDKKEGKRIMTLFGGEPLLAENKPIVSYIVNKGKELGYKFEAITNGYEVDSFTELLSQDAIYKLQITVDGPPQLHNLRRVHYKGFDTFDKIMKNIDLALKKGVNVVIRTNVDNECKSQYNDLKAIFDKLGYLSNSKFKLYSSILRNNSHIDQEEATGLSFLSIDDYTDSKNEIGYNDFGLNKRMHDAFTGHRSVIYRTKLCSAQANGYVLAPLGQIYPCWEVIGDANYKIGTYSTNSHNWNEENLLKWSEQRATNRQTCKRCKYLLFCGGGCPYHYINNNYDHCKIFRNTFRNAAIKAFSEL